LYDEQGWGSIYGIPLTTQDIVIRNGGMYHIEFSGRLVKVGLEVLVQKEGNIPVSTQSAQTTVQPVVQSTVQTIPPSITMTSQTQSPATTPATTATSMAQTTTSTPEIPEPTPIPEVSSAQPAVTSAPGDPATVLVSYSSLFNTGNGAGIYALLSENMKSNYPTDILNNELATARLNGYSIEKIQVNNQIIEGNNAILLVEISWNIDGSPVTSMLNVPLVYENNQWKLETLI